MKKHKPPLWLALAALVGLGFLAATPVNSKPLSMGSKQYSVDWEAQRANQHIAKGQTSKLANSQPANSQPRTVTYTYDDTGQLNVADYGEGAQLIYSYDPSGNLEHVSDHYGVFLPLVMR